MRYALDSENFSKAIYTVQPDKCFNLGDLPTDKDTSELYYFICKNECNVPQGDCCIAAYNFEVAMSQAGQNVEETSCIGSNSDSKLDVLCENQTLSLHINDLQE